MSALLTGIAGQNTNPGAQCLKNDTDHLRQGENNGNK